VKILMRSYLEEAINDFPEDILKEVTTPATTNIFTTEDGAPRLDDEMKATFHSIVAKRLFVSTHRRPDLHLTVGFLTLCVPKCDQHDWNKLRQLLSYIKGTLDLELTLQADSMNIP